MCGIAGWVGSAASPRILDAMLRRLAHRGPDGEGQVFKLSARGDVAALGHRRLAIIDFDTGAQPMCSHDERFTIVFNGEIYNYLELREELSALGARFATRSDTEVILEAWRLWGAGCLSRFRGMFAFALHDAVGDEIILARDPFGKKPLFLAEKETSSGRLVVFASEPEALFEHPEIPRRIDPVAVHRYLVWRYAPGPATFFSGVRKLSPGCMLRIAAGSVTERRFWTPGEARDDAPPPRPGREIETFIEIFEEAVKLRLRSDAPYGAFLSGGLDSASVVATAMRMGADRLRTFSIGDRDDPASEVPLAEETAKALGSDHVSIEFEADDLIDLMPRMSRLRGSPIGEPADLPIHLMSLEAARSVKCVLSGEGADELFAGYPKHVLEARIGGPASRAIAALAGRAVLAATAPRRARHHRLRIAARALKRISHEERMPVWFGALDPRERAALWAVPSPPSASLDRFCFSAPKGATPLQRVLHFDQTSWLPDHLLERLDRMTMAASIEARAPFVDVRLAAFANQLPDAWRIKGRATKRILREAMRDRLPRSVTTRAKSGFRLPVARWFLGELGDRLLDRIAAPASPLADYLDRSAVEKMLRGHRSGRVNAEKPLWALYALDAFLSSTAEDLGAGAAPRARPPQVEAAARAKRAR